MFKGRRNIFGRFRQRSEVFRKSLESLEVARTFSEILLMTRQKSHTFDSEKVGRYIIMRFKATWKWPIVDQGRQVKGEQCRGKGSGDVLFIFLPSSLLFFPFSFCLFLSLYPPTLPTLLMARQQTVSSK